MCFFDRWTVSASQNAVYFIKIFTLEYKMDLITKWQSNVELESKTNQSILDCKDDHGRYMKRYDSFIESKHNNNPSYSKMFCSRYSTITVMISNCFCYVFKLAEPALPYSARLHERITYA